MQWEQAIRWSQVFLLDGTKKRTIIMHLKWELQQEVQVHFQRDLQLKKK